MPRRWCGVWSRYVLDVAMMVRIMVPLPSVWCGFDGAMFGTKA
ncbi:hypothetical protein [Neoroseomonas lacus]|nr:hypothetical protein [Neoroseomonas lacus]